MRKVYWQGTLCILLCSTSFSSFQVSVASEQPTGTVLDEDPWDVTDDPKSQSSVGLVDTDVTLKETSVNVKPPEPEEPSARAKFWKTLTVRRFSVEIAILGFCVIYILNIFRGRRANSRVAEAWAREFCGKDGLFDRNFALLGTEEGRSPLRRHSATEFQLYCTGRRFCKFMEATLKLQSRQDLLNLLLGLVFPSDDQLDIEVYMKEGDMPQLVLAVATRKLMKAMLKEETGEDDVRKLTRKMEVGRDKLPSWPSDKLMVHAEHSSLFYDVMTERIAEQVFGQPAFATNSRYFRQLHFTSEQSYGPQDQRAVLRFSFRVPPIDKMHELGKLLSAVVVFIDILGNYKLSPDMGRRAEKLRQDLDKKESKEKVKEQQDMHEERRMAKRAEEMEKVKKMNPEQREKYEARKAKIENGRAQKRFVRRA